jgi:hypothetical protein
LNKFHKKMDHEGSADEKAKSQELRHVLQANLETMQENQEKALREKQARFEKNSEDLDSIISRTLEQMIETGRHEVFAEFKYSGDASSTIEFFSHWAELRDLAITHSSPKPGDVPSWQYSTTTMKTPDGKETAKIVFTLDYHRDTVGGSLDVNMWFTLPPRKKERAGEE